MALGCKTWTVALDGPFSSDLMHKITHWGDSGLKRSPAGSEHFGVDQASRAKSHRQVDRLLAKSSLVEAEPISLCL